MSRNRTLAAVFLLLAMLLAACGDTAPTPTAVPVPTATTATSSTEPTATTAMEAPTATTAAVEPTATTASTGNSGGTLNGVTLPADAAPADQQIYIAHFDNTADFTTIDFYESVYKRGGAVTDILSDPLVRLDKNFQVVPGAATKWEVDSTGLVWSFHLDPNLIWSDDTPVTAQDYVTTLRYGADPKHAWDFTWFFGGVIKNWNEAVAGTVPVDQIGVTAADDHTLQITTVSPAPYIPAMMLYSNPLQTKAFEAHGGLYNSDVATTVSSGPYVLKEWRKGDRLIYEANPKYKGNNKPFIQKVIVIGAAPSTDYASYQAGEIDFVPGSNLSPADNDLIAADPDMANQVHPQPNDFRTDYLFFDTKNPPFDKLEVRQAFSHVIDRDSLIQQIIKPSQGIPAYSFLMPGFPASNSKALSSIQNYDVKAAQDLMTKAGYPGGQGFPKITLWLRNEAPVRQALAQAIAASIKQNLGVDVEVSNKENKTFTDAMNAKPTQIQFGMVSYGMDFLDPYNMLSVWLGGGRHNWNNDTYDKMVKDAASFTGDPAERTKMFQDAEKLLVSDVGGVFIYHRYQSDIYKPYLKGGELEPDNNGVAAIHWPGFSNYDTVVGSMYISNEVSKYQRVIPNN